MVEHDSTEDVAVKSSSGRMSGMEIISKFEMFSVEEQRELLSKFAQAYANKIQKTTMLKVLDSFQQTFKLPVKEEKATRRGRRKQAKQVATKEKDSSRVSIRGRRPSKEGTRLKEVVEQIVQSHPEGIKVPEIFLAIESKPDVATDSAGENLHSLIRNYLSKLTKSGKLQRKGSAIYAPVNAQ